MQDSTPSAPGIAPQATVSLPHGVPEGWKRHDLGGFMGLTGPLYSCQEPAGRAFGLLAGPEHTNPAGVVHGGLLVTLLDHALSALAWLACERQPCVTVQLDSQFVAAAHPGQFLVARGRLVAPPGGLLFLQGGVYQGDTLCLSGSAVMKRLTTR